MSGTLTQLDAVNGITATTTNQYLADGTLVICRDTAVYTAKIDSISGTWDIELFYVYADGTRQRIAAALGVTATGIPALTPDTPFAPLSGQPIPTPTTIKYTKVLGVNASLTATVFGFYGD